MALVECPEEMAAARRAEPQWKVEVPIVAIMVATRFLALPLTREAAARAYQPPLTRENRVEVQLRIIFGAGRQHRLRATVATRAMHQEQIAEVQHLSFAWSPRW